MIRFVGAVGNSSNRAEMSMKIRALLVSVIVLHAAAVMAQSSCPSNPAAFPSLQSADLKSIDEVLSYPSNNVLRLSYTPSPKVVLRLYRNGVVLNPSSDYTLQGPSINLTGQVQQVSGDVYQAEYALDVASVGTGTALPVASMSSEASQELLTRYLQRSLDQNLSDDAARRTPVQFPAATTMPQPGDDSLREPRDLESLRMLATAMGRRSVAAESKTGQRQRTRGIRRSAQGVDGLGDHSLMNPFGLLAATPGGLSAAMDKIDSGSSTKRGMAGTKQTKPHVLRSLRMLESRLSESQ